MIFIQSVSSTNNNADVTKQEHSLHSSCDHYMFLILKKLLNATVKYNNTKCQPLIPIGIIKKCKEIKQYLLELHPSITIDLWINKDIELQKVGDILANETSKTRTGRGKNVIIQLLYQLDVLLNDNVPKNNNNINDNIHRIKMVKQSLDRQSTNDLNTNIINNNDGHIHEMYGLTNDHLIRNNNHTNQQQIVSILSVPGPLINNNMIQTQTLRPSQTHLLSTHSNSGIASPALPNIATPQTPTNQCHVGINRNNNNNHNNNINTKISLGPNIYNNISNISNISLPSNYTPTHSSYSPHILSVSGIHKICLDKFCSQQI